MMDRCRGLAWHQTNINKSLAKINQRLRRAASQNKEKKDFLNDEREYLLQRLKDVSETIGVLQKLAHDTRMRHAYARLVEEFESDDQWRSFLGAAANARADYTRERADLKRARVLAARIADICAQLIRDLSEFEGLGDVASLGPSEFVNPPGLVHEESYETMKALERASDDVLARHGLRLLDDDDILNSTSSGKHLKEQRFNILDALFESSQYIASQRFQRPETIDIVESIEHAARHYTPAIMGAAGAATESRKRSPKTQYLRAFWHLASLETFHPLTKTTNVIHALAITASVVLDDQVEDVSYDDVRKALEDRGARSGRNVPHHRKKSA
jgi:hypothetical protein